MLWHLNDVEFFPFWILQINHSAIHLKFRHKVTSFYHNNQRNNHKTAWLSPSSPSRLAEILDDERHLAGGEELGVLAEGALLQGRVERTTTAYPAGKAVDGHVRGCIGEV